MCPSVLLGSPITYSIPQPAAFISANIMSKLFSNQWFFKIYLRRCGLLVLAFVGLAPVAFSQSFAPYTAYSVGTYVVPLGIALADVDGDNRPDIITANSGANSVGVLLNTGNGTFQPIASYSTGSSSFPRGVALSDVNGDGKLDIITANLLASSVAVLLGNGNGTFQAAVAYSTGGLSSPYEVVSADVNGDGKPDIIAANSNTASVGVLLNNGNGTFLPVTTYSSGANTSPYGVAIGDVNGDGLADIITANYFGDSAGVLLNDGYGSFQPVVLYSTGSGGHPHRVSLADVNKDSKLDIITANFNNNSAGVLLGNGNGTFQPQATYPIGPNQYPYGAVAADIDGDTKPDLVAVNGTGNVAQVLLGTGSGTFQPFSSFATGSNSTPVTVAVADLNGDGRPDIVTGNQSNNTVSVLLNTSVVLATQPSLAAPQLTIWPNPVLADASIILAAHNLPASVSHLETTLVNSLGQKLRHSTLLAAQGTARGELPTDGLSPGLYLLHFNAYDAYGTTVGSPAIQRVCLE